jgi:ABC-type multidrug transport system fused ATPase/permease subunit
MAQISPYTIQRFWWKFIKTNCVFVALSFISGGISRYTALLISLSIGKYLEITFNNSTGKSKALDLLGISLPNSSNYFYLFFIITAVLHFIFTWCFHYTQVINSNNLVTHLRSKWIKKAIPAKYPFADILLPFTNEQKTIANYFTKGIIGLVLNGCYLVTVLYVGIALSANITILTAFLCLIIYFILKLLNHKLLPLEKAKRNAQGNLVKWLSQYLIQPDTDSKVISEKLDRKMNRLTSSIKQLAILKGLYLALIPALLYCLLGFILFMLSETYNQEELPPSDSITLILIIMLSLPSIKTVFRKNNLRQQGKLALKKFLEMPENNEIGDFTKKSTIL